MRLYLSPLLLLISSVGASPVAGVAPISASDDAVAYGCPLTNGTKIVVFADDTAGTGKYSAQWEAHFWSWFATNRSSPPPHQIISLREFEKCTAAQLVAAGTFVMPGGNAYTYTQHLGTEGQSKLREFVAQGGLYVGTCAGWFYASKG